ncbi:MAG: hypothetical protein ACLFQ0_13775 [Cyclobacteriaceae bacterium]
MNQKILKKANLRLTLYVLFTRKPPPGGENRQMYRMKGGLTRL